MTKNLKNQKGQALITLLFFMVVGIMVITASVIILFVSESSVATSEQGNLAYYVAESGAEDGILRLLRNPSYSGTYTIPVGSNQASVTITSGDIISTGTVNLVIKKVEVKTVYNNGVVSISSWKEIN